MFMRLNLKFLLNLSLIYAAEKFDWINIWDSNVPEASNPILCNQVIKKFVLSAYNKNIF